MSHLSDAELRELTQTILAILGPAIQAAVTFVSSTERAPRKCAQVWCPVCAVAATASGEEHPLLTVVADHGAALLTLIRAWAEAGGPDSPSDRDPVDGAPVDGDPANNGHKKSPGHYQPIPVIIHE